MTKKREYTQADVLRLAAEAQLTPRTAKRALDEGADALRARVDRERVREAARLLGLVLPKVAS